MTLKTLVITLITALYALFFMRAAPAEVVYIWDEDLRAAILKKLNKPNPKAAITKSDMPPPDGVASRGCRLFHAHRTRTRHKSEKHFISAGIPQCLPCNGPAMPRICPRSQP